MRQGSWRNNAGSSAFSKTDVASEWVCNDPDLAAAWTLDRFVTTAEMASMCRCRLDGKLTKIGEEWSLSACSANTGSGKAVARAPPAPSAVARAAHHTAQQEVE